MHPRDVSQRIIHLMHALGDTQVRFSKRTGISQQSINNWVKGRASPSLAQAIKICQRTGATLDYLYRGDVSGLPAKLLPPAA
jgi:transcriptional regulator with XRE-family HTH domain